MLTTQPIRVLLVDDHVVVRSGLAALLGSLGNFVVAGEAAHGEEAVRVACEVHPDLVLMDLSMPRMNGIEATRQLRHQCPAARILILSMHEDAAFVAQAFRAGASGYVVKLGTADELRMALETVAAGKTFLSPSVAGFIMEDYLRQGQAAQGGGGSGLSPRELEVLQLIIDGNTTDAIANLLSISPNTAQHHRANLKRKLGAHSNAELIKTAIEKNLVMSK